MRRSPEQLMRLALNLARSASSSDLPIAAIIFDESGSIIAAAENQVAARGQVTAHAEMLAIESVDIANFKGMSGQMAMAVTLEPCPMCAWAIRASGIGKLMFGAYNPQYGAVGSAFDLLRDKRHGQAVEVIGGVLEEECRKLLGDAFVNMRNNRGR